MKTRRFLLIAALALTITGLDSAHAGSVTWSAASDNGFADAAGTKLLAGDLLLLGAFDIPDSTIQANSGNVAFLTSHFTTYGTSTIGNNVGGLPGFFFKNSTGNLDTTTPFAVAGLRIYIWAFNTPTTTSATQQGIFSLNNSSAWQFPHENDNPNTTSVDLTDLTDGLGTALTPDADLVIGDFRQGVGNTLDFNLALVPEPSTYALALVGGVGLLLARRRAVKSRA